MIEEVKKFTTELQTEAFVDLSVLKEGKIPVVDSWTVEIPAPGVTLTTQR